MAYGRRGFKRRGSFRSRRRGGRNRLNFRQGRRRQKFYTVSRGGIRL